MWRTASRFPRNARSYSVSQRSTAVKAAVWTTASNSMPRAAAWTASSSPRSASSRPQRRSEWPLDRRSASARPSIPFAPVTRMRMAALEDVHLARIADHEAVGGRLQLRALDPHFFPDKARLDADRDVL